MFPARQDVLFKGVGEAEGLIPGIILLQQQPGAARTPLSSSPFPTASLFQSPCQSSKESAIIKFTRVRLILFLVSSLFLQSCCIC